MTARNASFSAAIWGTLARSSASSAAPGGMPRTRIARGAARGGPTRCARRRARLPCRRRTAPVGRAGARAPLRQSHCGARGRPRLESPDDPGPARRGHDRARRQRSLPRARRSAPPASDLAAGIIYLRRPAAAARSRTTPRWAERRRSGSGGRRHRCRGDAPWLRRHPHSTDWNPTCAEGCGGEAASAVPAVPAVPAVTTTALRLAATRVPARATPPRGPGWRRRRAGPGGMRQRRHRGGRDV